MGEAMSHYCVKWFDDSQRLLLVEVSSHWTWEESSCGAQQVAEMVKSVDHEVLVIYHYTNFGAAQLPRSTRVFANLKSLMQSVLPQQNKIIVVNSTSLMQGFMNILSKAYSMEDIFRKYHFVTTLEEALHLADDVNLSKTTPSASPENSVIAAKG